MPPSASWLLTLAPGWIVVTQRLLDVTRTAWRRGCRYSPRNRHLWWHPRLPWIIVERGNALGKACTPATLRKALDDGLDLVRLERMRLVQTVSLKQGLRISRLPGTVQMGGFTLYRGTPSQYPTIPRRARRLFAHVPTTRRNYWR